MFHLRNRRGQGLIEYLILVTLLAVGSIAVVRVIGASTTLQFAKVAKALGAKTEGSLQQQTVTESMYKKKDLSNFFQGAIGNGRKNDGGDDGDSTP